MKEKKKREIRKKFRKWLEKRKSKRIKRLTMDRYRTEEKDKVRGFSKIPHKM